MDKSNILPFGGARKTGTVRTDAEDRKGDGRPPISLRFGRWTFDPAHSCLEHGLGYWVPLNEVGTSARMLDWIFQVAAKSWATPDDIGQMVLALQEIFEPQARLCSFGQDTPFDAGKFLADRFPVANDDGGGDAS